MIIECDDNFSVETEIIKNECDEFQKNEDILHLQLDSDRFFKILEDEFGYSYKTINKYIEGGVHTPNEQHEFNIAIRKLKKNYDIDIVDSILYLEDTMPLNCILKFIDDETEWVLKEEMISRRGLKKSPKSFFDFIEEADDEIVE